MGWTWWPGEPAFMNQPTWGRSVEAPRGARDQSFCRDVALASCTAACEELAAWLAHKGDVPRGWVGSDRSRFWGGRRDLAMGGACASHTRSKATRQYSHYSVISNAICLQSLTVLRFLWLDLRSAAVRWFQSYWEEREVRKIAFTRNSDAKKSNFTCLRRTWSRKSVPRTNPPCPITLHRPPQPNARQPLHRQPQHRSQPAPSDASPAHGRTAYALELALQRRVGHHGY